MVVNLLKNGEILKILIKMVIILNSKIYMGDVKKFNENVNKYVDTRIQ